MVNQMVESARLWPGQDLFIFRIDFKTAFDKIYLSKVVRAIRVAGAPCDLVWALGRELVGNLLRASLSGVLSLWRRCFVVCAKGDLRVLSCSASGSAL